MKNNDDKESRSQEPESRMRHYPFFIDKLFSTH